MDKLKQMAGEKVDKAKEHLGKVGDHVDDKIEVIKTHVPDEVKEVAGKVGEGIDKVKEFKDEKVKFVKNMIRQKLEKIFDHNMNVANQYIKDNIKDPYMPKFVQSWVDTSIDSVWPDIKVEIKDMLLMGFVPDIIIDHGEQPACCRGILAFFRYHLFPYDRSIWRQLRDPVFILFNLLSLIPKYGIATIMYLWLLLVIDKDDEFQLTQYILNFKALQFINLGIISAVVGSVQYYICVSQAPSNCDYVAPQEQAFTLAFFVMNVVLVWISFLLLRTSKKKGGYFYQMEKDYQRLVQESAQNPNARLNALENLMSEDGGGDDVVGQMKYASEAEVNERTRKRLQNYLIYDFVCFLICVGLVMWAAFGNMFDSAYNVNEHADVLDGGNWKFGMTLYWVKALYGVLSFPFLLLKLPIVNNIISHARPTGYNPYGLTVPYLGIEETSKVPWKWYPPEDSSGKVVSVKTEL